MCRVDESTPGLRRFPFLIAADRIRCDDAEYNVINVVFAVAAAPLPTPCPPPPRNSPSLPLTRDDLQAAYDKRVTADHVPTIKEDLVWAQERGISRNRVRDLRRHKAKTDPRLSRKGPRR
jgi:hypothetical protein